MILYHVHCVDLERRQSLIIRQDLGKSAQALFQCSHNCDNTPIATLDRIEKNLLVQDVFVKNGRSAAAGRTGQDIHNVPYIPDR